MTGSLLRRLFPVCLCLPVAAQNLVPNPGFETFEVCPPYPGQIHHASSWDAPAGRTADFYHRCAPPASGAGVPVNLNGVQPPRSGDGYAGIRTWLPRVPGNPPFREYLCTTLTEPLVAGTRYMARFYVSTAESSGSVSPDIGLYVAKDSFLPAPLYPFLPQVSHPPRPPVRHETDWIPVGGNFIAEGGERFLLLGNFLPDSLMTLVHNGPHPPNVYFYVDDVLVAPCPSSEMVRQTIDTVFCRHLPALLVAPPDATSAAWSDGGAVPVRPVPTDGTYILTSVLGCDTLEQTFRVSFSDCECRLDLPSLLTAYADLPPFPANLSVAELAIFDVQGRLIRIVSPDDWPRLAGILPSGLYAWQARLSCGVSSRLAAGRFVFLAD